MHPGGDSGMAVAPCVPYGLAPAVDSWDAFGFGRGDYVDGGDSSAGLGERKTRPFLPTRSAAVRLGELHMCALDLPAAESFFEIKIEAQESEDNINRRGSLSCVLGGPRVHDLLMNKFAVAQGQAPSHQFVVGGLFGGGGHGSECRGYAAHSS